MKSTTLLIILLFSRSFVNAAEYHICGTSYMNAEQNCRSNPKCFNGQIAVGTPPEDCPETHPTCFTIISTEVICGGDGTDIQTGGDVNNNDETTETATAATETTTVVPEISDPMLIEPIDDNNNNDNVEEGGDTTTAATTAATTATNGTPYATELANNLLLSIQMNSNFNHGIDCAAHKAEWGLCYLQTFTFRYTGAQDYINNNNDFRIYFSSIHRVLHVDSTEFDYGHVSGDLTYLQPTPSFQGFKSDSEVSIPIILEYYSVQETDNMPRFFVVDTRDDSTAVIPNTDTEELREFVIPYVSSMKNEGDKNVPMTVENRWRRNEQLLEEGGEEDVDISTRIIPTPLRVEVADDAKTFDIFGVSLIYANLLGKFQLGAEDLISKITLKGTSTAEYSVQLVMVGALPEDIAGSNESYKVEIREQGTTITATHAAGLFYGVMSFIGLMDISHGREGMPITEMTIYDKPRFEYRGHQIDSARNFRTKESVLQTIDAMALYKLNNLHFGLSNDEGWRLEIPGLYELTAIGSRRCFDLSEETCLLTQLGSGPDASDEPQFYSRADFVEILKYAEARNVKVAPEFNMPGHARAAVVSMEARAKNGDDSYRLMDPEDETELLTEQFYDRSSIINPCLDSSVKFVLKLVDEVVKMYAEAQLGVDVWQFGGDEAKNILLSEGFANYGDLPKEPPFSKSPACIKKMQEDPTINIDTDAANYWALKVNQILAQKGIREMAAWEDGLNGMTKEEFEIADVSVNFWSTLFWGATDTLVEASKTGFGVIMANPDYLYFDFPYEVHPEERGKYWGARDNSVYKVFSFAPENLPQNAETSVDSDGNAMDIITPDSSAPVIKGMQGQTWSETVRTETQHQEMTFPRVLAVAERAWHRGSWELDWTPNQNYQLTTNHIPKDQLAADFKGFNSVLGCREVRKIFERLGIAYRVPPPGATLEGGILIANTELPCTRIQYSLDRGATWTEYSSLVEIGEGKHVSLRSVNENGALGSRVVTIDQEDCLECQGVCESNPLMPFNTPQICDDGDVSTPQSPPTSSPVSLSSNSPTNEPSAITFPILTNTDPTSSPSSSTLSIPEGDRCTFCEGGIPDVSIVPANTGGQSCGDIKQTAASHISGDQLCDFIQAVESTCCPAPRDPCTFCEGGILDLTVKVPEAGGQTCGEVLEMAAGHIDGDTLCNTIKAEESTCCPPPPADPCTFCEGGIPDLTVVVADAGGQTCGEVLELAADYSNGSGLCESIQAVESACCPSEPVIPCAFCEEGVFDLAVVVPEAGGKNCGEIQQTAASHITGDAMCNTIQSVERKCCPNMAAELADNLSLRIDMAANFGHDIDCASLDADGGLCYSQFLAFEYSGSKAYRDKTFAIYFSSTHRLLNVDHPDFEFGNVMGDLNYIKPTQTFEGFEPSAAVTLPLVFEHWSVQEADNMPRFFVVDTRDDTTAVIPNTDTEDLREFVIPYVSTTKSEGDNSVPMTAENRWMRNEQLSEGVETDTSTRIIPTPFRVETSESSTTFGIEGVTLINADLLGRLQSGAEDLISKITLKATSGKDHMLMLTIGTLPADIAGDESYMMEITLEGTTITASQEQGLFYGVMSFIGLLDTSSSRGTMPVKEMTIYDKPRFEYRGHQIDSARNFRNKESVLQTIDAMALYKLNNLHFGLSNDEGWRLEIPGLEELTAIGSRRCFDLSEETCLLTQLGSGPNASDEPQFYSVADFVEILKYAEARNVKIAPEFNMPGHARAAVVSMEARAKNGDDSYRLMDPEDETELLTEQFYDRSSIINPCLDSSVKFVLKLVDEVVKMYAEAQLGVDVWQFGGNEVKNILLGGGYANYGDLPKEPPFSKSPACIQKMQEDPTINIDTNAANYWALKVNQILAQKGIREMVAWEDGLNDMTKEEFEIADVSVNFWSTLFWGATDALVDVSKTGFGVIMANPDYLYFDFPYEVHPEERGDYWATRDNSVYKVFSFAPENLPQNAETSVDSDGNAMDITTPVWPAPVIMGMQGQTWSETERTETQHQEMTFPRVLAVAERAWHRGSWELDWTPNQNYQLTTNHIPKDQLAADFKGFNSVLGCREVRKIWQRLSIAYRVPPPGATLEGGILIANTELPCTRIQYSLDRGANWSEYFGPVEAGEGKHVSLKSLSSDGALESRVVIIDQEECLSCQGICESNPLMPFNMPQICDDGDVSTPQSPSSPPLSSSNADESVVDDSTSLLKNPLGNEFFCGDEFATIAKSCLLHKPCPGGLSSFCEDGQGCFKVTQCAAEYTAAGATSTEAYNTPQVNLPSERCRICGEEQIHSDKTVFFEGEEFLCREFDGVFNEGGRGADSPSCALAKELYTDTCCIASDDGAPAASPTVFEGGDYPTLWIMNPKGAATKCSLTLALVCAIMTSFFVMHS